MRLHIYNVLYIRTRNKAADRRIDRSVDSFIDGDRDG